MKTKMQIYVTKENGTEPPFDNEYNNNFKPGIYVDIYDGTPLFISSRKYQSGCGWPAFSRPINDDVIEEVIDLSHGMKRIEVRSKSSDSHLGHVFNDGPKQEGGLRYCINSASLRFIAQDDMIKEGYEAYLELLDK